LNSADSTTPPSSNLIKRVSSSTSLSGYGGGMSNSSAIGNVFMSIWKQLLALCIDSHPEVAALANRVVSRVRSKISLGNNPPTAGPSQSAAITQIAGDSLRESRSDPSFSEPSSPLVHSYLTDSIQSAQRRERQSSESSSQAQHTSRRERQSSECNSGGAHGSQGNLLPGTIGRERQSSEGSNSGHVRTLSSNSAQYNASMLTPFQRKRKIFGKEPPQEHSLSDAPKTDESMLESRVEIISTRFIDWCIKQFNDLPAKQARHLDLESVHNQKREWRLLRNYSLQSAAREERCRMDFTRTDEVVFVQKNAQIPRQMRFHPYEPLLFVAERETCSVWSWDSQPTSLVQTFSNCNLPNSRITGMQLINPAETASIMLACDDGSVKLWKLGRGVDGCGWRETSPKLITAFSIFHQMIPSAKSPGTLLHWEQNTSELIAAGDSKMIRIWDAHKEMKSKDLVLGSDNPLVTSIHSDSVHCICVGCADGSVRIYDKRLAMNDSRVITFREHNSSIVNARLFPDDEKHAYIISGSASGDIKFWDKRSSVRSIKTIQMPANSNLTAMSFHPMAETFAW
jgi:regulator-associated protein of mTOR